MLNPSFSKETCASVCLPYVAPQSIVNRTIHGNESFATGQEYRLQSAYTNELWMKLERAGLTPAVLNELSVLEVCAGTGFLTFHLLSKCSPKSLVVNDISASEMASAQNLIQRNYPSAKIDWILGDMHTVAFEQKFDVIIGNSFIHHFYNVPQVLSRFHALLKPGGMFITLHEPTPMGTVVEAAKMSAYPLALLAPKLVNDMARARYTGEPSATDLWMFEPIKLKQVAIQAGFSAIDMYPWHLLRAIIVQKKGMHLSENKPQLSDQEQHAFCRAIRIDSILNRLLSSRFFGSICCIFHK